MCRIDLGFGGSNTFLFVIIYFVHWKLGLVTILKVLLILEALTEVMVGHRSCCLNMFVL